MRRPQEDVLLLSHLLKYPCHPPSPPPSLSHPSVLKLPVGTIAFNLRSHSSTQLLSIFTFPSTITPPSLAPGDLYTLISIVGHRGLCLPLIRRAAAVIYIENNPRGSIIHKGEKNDLFFCFHLDMMQTV